MVIFYVIIIEGKITSPTCPVKNRLCLSVSDLLPPFYDNALRCSGGVCTLELSILKAQRIFHFSVDCVAPYLHVNLHTQCVPHKFGCRCYCCCLQIRP